MKKNRRDIKRDSIVSCLLIAAAFFFLAEPAPAYYLNIGEPVSAGGPYPQDYLVDGRKWGNPTLGTPGSASFSVMPAGVGMDPWDSGLSTDFSAMIAGDELAIVHSAMAVWTAPTNGRLVDLGTVPDNGAAYNSAPVDPQGTTGPFGDIRLAAVKIKSGALAHAFYPPPNGTSASGDVHFDNGLTWVDDPNDHTGNGQYDFFTVALHELGHSLGLGHEDTIPDAVMYPYYQGAKRALHNDDIAGIREIYVPEPATLLLFGSGLLGIVGLRRKKKES